MREVGAAGSVVRPARAVAMKTLRVKVRSSMGWLNKAAREVNQVWNWANATSHAAATRTDART